MVAMRPSESSTVHTIASAAVVGSGVMGSGIAQVLATAGVDTILCDVNPTQLDRARERISEGRYGLKKAVDLGLRTEAETDAALGRLRFTTSVDALADVALVIEAIPERLDLKVGLFRTLDSVISPTAIFASNSSGLSIAAMAAATDRPDRVVGWHWASPPVVQKLAEIVRSRATSDHTIDAIEHLARLCGKNPVVIQESDRYWGYAANRIYIAMVAEAERVVAEGVATQPQVDQLMRDAYGWPAGPFALLTGAREGWGEGWSRTSGSSENSDAHRPPRPTRAPRSQHSADQR